MPEYLALPFAGNCRTESAKILSKKIFLKMRSDSPDGMQNMNTKS